MMHRVSARLLLAALLAGILPDAAPRVYARLIPCLSGFVRTSGGSPVAGADLDFFVSGTGEKLITPGDNTDATGFYNVCVLPGVYDVTFAPPPGTRLLGRVFPQLDLTANVGRELNVTLETGFVMSGSVTSASSGQGVEGVDFDADVVGGGRLFTPDDNTDANGDYRVVVPAGLFRFRYEPVPGSRLRGLEMDSVAVAGDQLIDVVLEDGLLLFGRVRSGSGAALAGVTVDLRDGVTGEKVFVANNDTDAAGDYSVAVPAGTFELRYVPPRGAPYVAVSIAGFQIGADTQRDQVLQDGHRVTVIVRDFNGEFVVLADIDVKENPGGAKVFTPHDRTDSAGAAELALVSGSYDLRIDPPAGTTLDRVELTGVAIDADTTITVVLPEVARWRVTGRLTDPAGTGLPGVQVDARLSPSGQSVFIPSPFSDAAGDLDLSIPGGLYNVHFSPPRGSRSVGIEIANVAVAGDSSWGNIPLQDGLLVTIVVNSPDGRAVANANLDFYVGASSSREFVPHDRTDAAGSTVVALLPGEWRIRVKPPSGSGYESLTAGPAAVFNDTTITIVLRQRISSSPPAVSLGAAFPNPFRDLATVGYEVGATTDVTLDVFDVRGSRVRVLRRQEAVSGRFEASWDGTDDRGRGVPTGVYFIRLRTSLGDATRKVLVLR
ncbi:MAG: T9SS type A sorting domain-containing protein [Candidatus Krumholzibacteria bacterium]|nr:T9SS type A sorting domain-containing protein [Candidatus Krumholzibacteria bacterium]